MEQTEYVVTEELAGQRLDRALTHMRPDLSRTRAQQVIRAGEVRVDGKPVKSSLVLEAGQHVTLSAEAHSAPTAHLPEPEALPLSILYEDEAIIVLDKPAGQVVHPAPGHERGTLVNALLAHVPGLAESGEAARPGIVHRLDKDTSGLLIIAKTPAAHTRLTRQMSEHTMIKRYLALVEGHLPNDEGVIDAPIGRDQTHRQRMGIVVPARGGREARTRFRVLRELPHRSLVELQLETGRTHQIRVHLAALHHPVVGDLTYGRAQSPMPPRHFLHAAHLEFSHPITGEWLSFDSPLPDDLARFLAALDA